MWPSYHDDEEVEDAHPSQLGLDQRHQVLAKVVRMRNCFISTTFTSMNAPKKDFFQCFFPPVFQLYLSAGGPDAPSSVHYAGDGGQSLLAAPERLLPAQVGRDGRADHGGGPADEEAGGGQQGGVYGLVVGGAWGQWWVWGGRDRGVLDKYLEQ